MKSKKVFVPLTDELLYEHPERISGPLIPFSPDLPCHHWLEVEVMSEQEYALRRVVPGNYPNLPRQAA